MTDIENTDRIKLFVFLFLCVLGIAYCIYSFFVPDSVLAYTVMNLLIYAACIFYRLLGYKIKGTRLIKHTMIFFVVVLVIKSVSNTALDPTNMYLVYSSFLLTFSAVLAMYMAGRLVRVKENKMTFALILALLLAQIFVRVLTENTSMILDAVNIVVQWMLIGGSYLVRAGYIQKIGLEEYKKELLDKLG